MFQTHIGLIRKLRISAFLAGAFLFVLFGLALFPVHTNTEKTLAIPKQSETVMTLSTEDLTLDFNVTSVDGSFADNTANVSVTTNNATGYTLSINTGNTGDNAGKLVGEDSVFNPISSATTEADFTANTSYNGLWGYKPSILNGEENTNYLPVPTSTTTIEETSAPNAEVNVYTIGLGARANFAYEADSYTNSFIITSVANPVGYTIDYNKNTEDEVNGMPASQTGSTTDVTITLSDSTPEREGYEFLGWCEGDTTATSNIDECTSTTYDPGDEYEIDHLGGTETTLNAMWKANAQKYTVNYMLGGSANTVEYRFAPITEAIAYSHTPNINDAGERNGNYTNNMNTNEVITVPGATKFHVVLSYGGESVDWVSIWSGSHPDYSASSNYSSGAKFGGNTSGKYGGGTLSTVEGDIETEDGSITFGFRSDVSVVGYGYYAVITVVEGNDYFYNNEVLAGIYSENVGANNVFLGWSETENDTEVTYATESDVIAAADFDVANTITLYPVIGYPTNISFNAHGGTGTMGDAAIPYNTTANLPAFTFENYSYKFMGWNTEEDGSGDNYADTAEFTATVQAGANVTLYAQWQEVQIYTVNYVDRGETNTVNYASYHTGAGSGIRYSHTSNISDEGVQNGNYANNLAFTDVVEIPGATHMNITLSYGGEGVSYDWVSLWEGNHSNYTASDNYGTGMKLEGNTTGKYGGSFGTVHGEVDGDAVTFAFRSDSSNGGYGYYAAINYTDIYKYVYSGEYTTPTDDTDVFLGWNTDPDATTVLYANEQELYDAYDGVDEVTLYAIWGKPTNITYDANEGTGEMAGVTVTYGNTITLAKNIFARTGYEFVRWSTNATGDGTNYGDEREFTATAVHGEDVTLYAQWMPIQNYTVNFVNGETTNSVIYECHKSGTASPVFSHTPNIDNSGVQNGNYANGLSINEVVTLDGVYNTEIVLTYGGEGESYDWVSMWAGNFPNYTASNNYSTGIKIGGNTTGKYGGTQKTVRGKVSNDTITFAFRSDNSNGGYGYYAVMQPATVCNEDEISGTYSDLSDEDDVFLGWDKNPDATSATYADESAVVQNLNLDDGTTETVYAIWGKPTYISFDANGGTGEMETVQVTYNTTINLPANTLAKENAVFVRWATSANDTGTKYNDSVSFKATNMHGENITLYAIWGEQTIIHFDANGGEGEMEDMVLTYNTTRTLPANTFTKENAVYQKWNTKEDGTGSNYNNSSSYKASSLAGAEITLYAVWGEPTVVNYHNNGGIGSMDSQIIIYNTTENFSENSFTKQDAVFVRWNTAADRSGDDYEDAFSYTASDMAGKTIDLYAVWGEQTTINYYGNGGSGPGINPITINYGETINLAANTFEKAGSEFLAWNTSPNGTGISYSNMQQFTASVLDGEVINLYAFWIPTCSPIHEQVNRTTDSGISGITIARAYEIAYTAKGKGMYEETEYGNGIYQEVTDGNYKSYDVRFAMQDMTPEICASVSVMHDDYEALDIRDNKIYHITKMQDGHCWMTQNLDLDLESEPTNVAPLTHYNTDLGWTNFDETATWIPKNSTITFGIGGDMTGVWPNRDAGGSYIVDRWNPHSANPGSVVLMPSVNADADMQYDSVSACVEAGNTREVCSHYKLGNYYNWTAMIAENNTNTSYYRTPYNVAPNSICPAGWRMPNGPKKNTSGVYTSENTSEFNKLLVMENITQSYVGEWGTSGFVPGTAGPRMSPLYMTEAGSIAGGGSMSNYGRMILYWTNTVEGTGSSAYLMRYWGRGVNYIEPQINSGHGEGNALRCVAR